MYLMKMYKEDLALNNPQRLICHKPQLNQSNWSCYHIMIVYFMHIDKMPISVSLFLLNDVKRICVSFCLSNSISFK